MKKRICIIFRVILAAFVLCGCSGKKEDTTVLDAVRNASVVKLETSDSHTMYVDSEIDTLKSFADLEIHEAPLEPADSEDDWIYRMTFDPSEKVSGSEEIVVAFHDTYLQINSEYYLPEEGVAYSSILDWAQSKFDYFFEIY